VGGGGVVVVGVVIGGWVYVVVLVVVVGYGGYCAELFVAATSTAAARPAAVPVAISPMMRLRILLPPCMRPQRGVAAFLQ
jgi:hypothetical protein